METKHYLHYIETKLGKNETERYLIVVSEETPKVGELALTTISELDVYNSLEYYDGSYDALYAKKVIAHLPIGNSPIIECIDLLPSLSGVEGEALAWKYDGRSKLDAEFIRAAFKAGYSAACEKYKYTDVDVFSIIDVAQDCTYVKDWVTDLKGSNLTFDEIVYSVLRSRLPTHFVNNIDGDDIIHRVNENSQIVWIGKYIYN
jgi:hypothetical protein